jgi:hypothetical protein
MAQEEGMTMGKDNRDSPQWHGGTIGDRFADAGHAARPKPVHLRNGGGGGRNPAGRSCAGLVLGGLVAVAGVVALVVGLIVTDFTANTNEGN